MSESEKAFPRPRFPVVTLALLLANLVGFMLQLKQGSGLSDFLNDYSFVPAQTIAYLLGTPGTSFTRSVLPFFGTLFIHSGVVHLLLNTWYLWLIGDVLESFFGRTRLVILWLAGTVVWGVVTLMTVKPPASGFPCLGSGGALAAFLGAYFAIYCHLLRVTDRQHRRRLLMVGTPIALAALAWFPLQLTTKYSTLTPSLHTEHGPPWWALLSSLLLGALLVQLALPSSAAQGQEAEPVEPTEPAEPIRPTEHPPAKIAP